MRRSDREIKDINLIEKFIAKEQKLRIAFYDDGDIYIVPVNYGYVYENNRFRFYFHGAKAGRKFELSQKKPKVGFEIDGNYELIEGDIACDYSAKFQSVIGTGTLGIVDDKDEKILGLNKLMKQTTRKESWSYSDEMLRTTAIFRLDVDKMSCKLK
ncbi:MAG: pyridoxamine 5'-phosphate oxidase family protein [Oscillospiraceae bacterium]|nr:pyridoxamine 5'-phosphate oxidase family protein [Oscillospiraceae bacterium]